MNNTLWGISETTVTHLHRVQEALFLVFPGDRPFPCTNLPRHKVNKSNYPTLLYRFHGKQIGSLFSPGDELTLSYIWGQKVSKRKWELKCAQTLIYSKIISKEETLQTNEVFPHTRNEIESISAVQTLSIEDCKTLFQKIRTVQTKESMILVKNYLK